MPVTTTELRARCDRLKEIVSKAGFETGLEREIVALLAALVEFVIDHVR